MSFLAAMTAVTGVLALGDHDAPAGFLVVTPSVLVDTPSAHPVLRTETPLDYERWRGIVIHHSGTPSGDPDSIRKRHLEYGFQSMGYHFLIGNGNGLGDGVIHVGERWVKQQPGVHTAGPHQTHHNLRSIGICLVGNGDRRAFSDRQMTELVRLVQGLQRELKIPSDQVFLHRELAPEDATSPGRFFAESLLDQQLLTVAR